ncbi:DNA integrity scanning diadenylate cyclase DisA [Stomatohabitans albus]|uniref:DNA integrity scanning diadenylate cyclase DisA n=1 Tax=Stomatohabitans albus TaxID=3110766 RepID=UPI00300D527B
MEFLNPSLLSLLAPGQVLREGIERIIKAGKGALIVVGNDEEVDDIRSGGFRLRTKLTAQNLSEVAKMDGAIIISDNAEQIIWANVHLVPNASLETPETGTRHRTADRVAQQTGRVVITVSESMQIVSVFQAGEKYVLESVSQVLFRGNQAISALDRYRSRLDEVSTILNLLELDTVATLFNVTNVMRRAEWVNRLSLQIEDAILLLGDQGNLLRIQLDELLHGVDTLLDDIIRDYAACDSACATARDELASLSDNELLDDVAIAGILGIAAKEANEDRHVTPRGYRLVHQIQRLPNEIGDKAVEAFQDLDRLREATAEELHQVEGISMSRARLIRDGLERVAVLARQEVGL